MANDCTTFALCVYLDPTAPCVVNSDGNQETTRLANYQWLRVRGRDATPESTWKGAGDDPLMKAGRDYLAAWVIDMSGRLPDKPTFNPFWKSRESAGRWTQHNDPPYEMQFLEPVPVRVRKPPGLNQDNRPFKTWFFAPIQLKHEERPMTYSLSGAVIGIGDDSYWVDPEMENEPP